MSFILHFIYVYHCLLLVILLLHPLPLTLLYFLLTLHTLFQSCYFITLSFVPPFYSFRPLPPFYDPFSLPASQTHRHT